MMKKNVFKKIGLLLIAIMLSISVMLTFNQNKINASSQDDYFVYEEGYWKWDISKWGYHLGTIPVGGHQDFIIDFDNVQKSKVYVLFNPNSQNNLEEIVLKDSDSVKIRYSKNKINNKEVTYLELFINDILIGDDLTTSRTTNVYNFTFKYKSKVEKNHNTVADLPLTDGVDYTDSSKMGRVKYTRSNYLLDLTIDLKSEIHSIQFNFSNTTDMSIFNNSYESYYFTNNDGKFVLINHGDESIFFQNKIKETFIPFTLWNLTTNQITTYDRFNVYIYTQMESGKNAYAYWYVDQFVIDNLTSATLAFKYQYDYYIGGLGDPIEEFIILEADKYTDVNKFTWETATLYGLSAGLISGVVVPGIGVPMAIIGTLLAIDTTKDLIVTPGSVNQIKKVNNPSTELVNNIVNTVKKEDPNFSIVNKNIFKLHLGQFDKFFTSGIKIDKSYTYQSDFTKKHSGINIMQFTYETDGKVYTIEGDSINPILELGKGTDGNGPSLDSNNQGLIIIGLIVLGVGYIFLDKKAYKNKSNFAKFAIIIAAIVLIIMLIVSSWQSILGIFK